MIPPDDTALQRRLQELFLEELDEQLELLLEGLDTLAEASTGDAAPVVADMFRWAHSLKGAAFAAGATPIGSVCHDLEDLLARLRDGDSDLDPPTVNRLTALLDVVVERGRELRATSPAPPGDVPPGSESAALDPIGATEGTAPPDAPDTTEFAGTAPNLAATNGDGAGPATAPPTSQEPLPTTGTPLPPDADPPTGASAPAGPAAPTGETGHPAPALAASATTGPADMGRASSGTPPLAASTLRVAGHKVDSLMDQAADLMTVTYGSEGLVEALRRAERRLLDEELEQRRERDRLLAALPDPAARELVATAFAGLHTRARTTTQELRQLLAQVSAHQQSLRTRARGFAEAARRTRMVPFGHATSSLPRMVRELAADLRKQVELRITDTDVEVDMDLVHVLRDVLGHLVRNAVDHGIERPEDRARAGKPLRGTVQVKASLHSDGVRIVVSDDGRGLDEQRLRRAAAAQGGAPEDRSAAELAFRPGLSTAPRVSAVSGRGVGLDAVRSSVERRGGTISVRSEPGRGCAWTVLVPLNLSSMRALVVRAGGELVALPSTWVRRLVPVPPDVVHVDGRRVVQVGHEALPLATLSTLLGWDPPPAHHSARTGVVLGGGTEWTVLAVEDAVAEREIVLRGSPERLEEVRLVLGTAQMEDGSVILVLNPAHCLRLATVAAATEASATPTNGAPRGERRVLLAEDSLTTRELERSLLESAGFSVVVAHDGQQAWELLQTTPVDAVVSDVNMPRMDGIELCRAIRGSTRLGNLPVVLVTSLHTDTDRRAGLDAGADAYLTKVGFNRDDLVAALERVL